MTPRSTVAVVVALLLSGAAGAQARTVQGKPGRTVQPKTVESKTVQATQDKSPIGILHYEPVAMMSSSAAATQSAGARGARTVNVSFYTLGREFDLQLEEHDPFAPGALIRWVDESGVVEEEPPTGIFFRGRVDGDPGSWVRITMVDDALSGIVATDDELYILEPAERLGATAATSTVAFRMSDVDDLDVACGTEGHRTPRGRRGKTKHGSMRDALRAMLGDELATTAAAAQTRQADLGIVTDYEYFQSKGAGAANALTEIINAVDGIYMSEINVTVRIASMVIHTSASDPFSDTTVPVNLLTEAASWRDNNDNNSSQSMWQTDLTHLFTGRDLNSNVIGIAYLQSLCSSNGSTGVDQDWTTSVNLMSMLVAHEMGHNFAAPHDNQAGSDCAFEPGTFIMNPSIGNPNQQRKFSPCSKGKINPYLDTRSCIGPAGPPPPTATPTNTTPPTPTRTPTLGVPSVTAPGAGQVVGVEGVTFSWTAVGGANAYDLRVQTSAGATIFNGTLSGGNSTSTLIGLPNNGSYTFRVRACRAPVSDGTCGAFGSRSFSVNLVSPAGSPTITFPQPGAVLTTSQQNLSWTTVTGNPVLPDLFYEVRLTNRNTGATELQFRTIHPTVQSSVTLASLPYRMQVRACQAACGPFSPAVDFSVALAAVPTSAPTITDTDIVQGNILDVEWTAVDRAEWYQVQVIQPGAGPGGGALTVAAQQVAGTSAELVIPMGNAAVIVAGCNGDGCGPYSGVASVDGGSSNPSAPQVGAPLNGSVVNGPSITFTWSRVPGDTGNTTYRLYVQDLSRQRAALDVYTTQNFFGALLKAEGGRYAALVIANPGPSQVTGPVSTFTVRGSSAVAPTLMAPTHGSMLDAGNVLLGWTPVPGATLYEYLVSVQGQPTASGRGVTPGLFVQVPLAAVSGQPTVYNGIVRACPAGQVCTGGSDANWGPWSSAAGSGVISFTVMP